MDYNVPGSVRAMPYKKSGKCKISQTLFNCKTDSGEMWDLERMSIWKRLTYIGKEKRGQGDC